MLHSVDEAKKIILGDPPKIQPSQTVDPDCLYQAFATAITTFSTRDIPERFLSRAFDDLVQRVDRSNNPNAKPCLETFKRCYRREINTLSSSGKGGRQRGMNRRGQPMPGRR